MTVGQLDRRGARSKAAARRTTSDDSPPDRRSCSRGIIPIDEDTSESERNELATPLAFDMRCE